MCKECPTCGEDVFVVAKVVDNGISFLKEFSSNEIQK